jgi:uncharacterized protein YegP (UPF0339 family)
MAYKAFVSSTFVDLKEHRAYVIDALRKAGFFVDPMEAWTADSDEPKTFSQARVVGCDLCVLIVGFRRGYVPDNEIYSITQLEYRAARKRGIDVLVFVLDEESPWPRKYGDLDKDPELRNWRKELQKDHGVQFFGLEPSSIKIADALSRWLVKQNEQRTAQHDYEACLKFQPELADLEQECQTGDTDGPIRQLRAMIIARLKALALKNGYDTEEKPPMDLLRQLADAKVINSEALSSLEYSLTVTSEILYDKKVSRREAIKAVCEAAAGFYSLSVSDPNLPHFKLITSSLGLPSFVFSINNQQLIFGQRYQRRDSALCGIRSARHAVERNSIEKKEAATGKLYFSLIAANGQIVGTSDFFDSEDARERSIQLVRQYLPSAPVVEDSI